MSQLSGCRDDTALVSLANEMLSRLHVSTKVTSCSDIDAALFVTLYEGLCAEPLKDAICEPRTVEDEVHNCQAVIDSLSLDVLSTPLSHITGQSIVDGDRTAIGDLLEVCFGLMEFILEEISSSTSTDGLRHSVDDDDHEADPDLVTPEVLECVLDIHRQKTGRDIMSSYTTNHRIRQPAHNKCSIENLVRNMSLTDTDNIFARHSVQDCAVSSKRTMCTSSNAFSGMVHQTGGVNATIEPQRLSNCPSVNSAQDQDMESCLMAGKQRPISRAINDEPTVQTDISPPQSMDSLDNFPGRAKNTVSNERRFDSVGVRSQKPIPISSLADSHAALSGLLNGHHNLTHHYDAPVPDGLHTAPPYSSHGAGSELGSSVLQDTSDDLSQFQSSLPCDVTSFEQQLAGCKEHLQKKAKAVRFEDYLDDLAPGYTGELRREFKTENQKSRIKKEFIAKVYEDELHGFADCSKFELKSWSKSAKQTESNYKKMVLKPPQTAQYKTNKFAKPKNVLRLRSRSHLQAAVQDHKRSASASPNIRQSSHAKKLPDNDIFPWLLEEFPYLHLAPRTLHNLWHKGSLQLEQLTCAEAGAKCKKSKAQEQIEEAERRQQLLFEILHKEQTHRQRLKETAERRQLKLAAQSKVREHRLQSARVRKYYEEFQVRQRSRMLKKRTKEELVFKRLFNDGLAIQKESIRELHKYAKEQRLEHSKRQQLELEALENYYKNQFALLAESVEHEKNDINTREKAQMKVLMQMKRELRKKMEQEISEFQRRLWQDEDEVYFRELDAERIRHKLHLVQTPM